LSQRTRFYLC